MFQVPSLKKSSHTFPTLGGHLILLVLTPLAFGLGAIGGLLTLATAVCAVGWWNARKRLALMRSAPLHGISGAPSSYLEVRGHAESLDDQPLRDPLTHEPCLWFGIETYRLRFNTGRFDDRIDIGWSWDLVGQACSSRDFAIRDEAAVCRVRVAGAQMALAQRKMIPSGVYFWHVLWRIRSDDALFVRGDVAPGGGANDASLHERQVSEPEALGRYVVADHTLDYEETDLEKAARRYLVALAVSAILLLGWLMVRGS